MQERNGQPQPQPTLTAALTTLAAELATDHPNAPARYWTIRGRARTHGMTTDQVDLLLPQPHDGEPRYGYATRLRHIARAH